MLRLLSRRGVGKCFGSVRVVSNNVLWRTFATTEEPDPSDLKQYGDVSGNLAQAFSDLREIEADADAAEEEVEEVVAKPHEEEEMGSKFAVVNRYAPLRMEEIRKKYQDLDWAEVQATLAKADEKFFVDEGGDTYTKVPHRRFSPQKTASTADEELDEANKLAKILKFKFRLQGRKRSYKYKGGVRESYSALMMGGDGKGVIGWGLGKGPTMPAAAQRARRNVAKNLVYVPLNEDRTFFQDVIGQHNQTYVILKRGSRGQGLTGCTLLKAVCRCLGILDGTAKIIGRRNPMTVIYAIFNALRQQTPYRDIALNLGRNYYHLFEASQVREKPPTWAALQKQANINMGHVTMAKQSLLARQQMNANLSQGLTREISLDDQLPTEEWDVSRTVVPRR